MVREDPIEKVTFEDSEKVRERYWGKEHSSRDISKCKGPEAVYDCSVEGITKQGAVE